jgi:hypothetical protein
MLPVAYGPEPPHRRENPKSFDLIEAFDGGGRSPSRTRLHLKFPANREINREFRRIHPLGAILKADTRANPKACSKILYSTEQGNFAKEQGICTREQGN